MEQLDYLDSQLQLQHQKNIQQTDVAFVILNRQRYAKQVILRHHNKKKNFTKFTKLFTKNNNNLELKIKRADEPDDLIWENIGFDKKEKRRMKRKTVVMTCILLLVCFVIILSMQSF